jgi:hypothetical protein
VPTQRKSRPTLRSFVSFEFSSLVTILALLFQSNRRLRGSWMLPFPAASASSGHVGGRYRQGGGGRRNSPSQVRDQDQCAGRRQEAPVIRNPASLSSCGDPPGGLAAPRAPAVHRQGPTWPGRGEGDGTGSSLPSEHARAPRSHGRGASGRPGEGNEISAARLQET